MEDDSQEPADETEVVRLEQPADESGVGAEPAVGAGLARLQAELAHLREHAVGLELEAPAGHFADAPGDRARRHAVEELWSVGHRRPSGRYCGWSALTLERSNGSGGDYEPSDRGCQYPAAPGHDGRCR